MARTTVLAWACAGALALLSLYLFLRLREAESERPYLAPDARAIELAKRAFMAETGADRASSKGRFPMVIRFGGVRCVALKVRRGYLGRTPVYCFDMDYRRVTAVDTRAPEVLDTRETSLQPPVTE
jgi:hypothetical protein